MKRHENRPTSLGFGSVPLFNQRKRNRVPLTSAPTENEFFFHSDFTPGPGPAVSANASKPHGCYQTSGPGSDLSQSHSWKMQSFPTSVPLLHYGGNRPPPGPGPRPGPGPAPVRHCAPVPHPYKAGDAGSRMGAHSKPARQQESSSVANFRQRGSQPFSTSAQRTPAPDSGFSQMSLKSLGSAFSAKSEQFRPLAHPTPPHKGPSVRPVQPEKSSWKFTHSFGSQSEGNGGPSQHQAAQQNKPQVTSKPASEKSLRILTAVIAGMRHWSQLKDRVPHLLEIFATLDSAVTLGQHGAKNFLLRDGKEVVQCVFYENEQVLPRLVRGQVHRCVGSYDRSRDVLTCVSVRPGLPSELRNAQDAVKVCDTEMRAVLKSFSEV